MIHRNLVRVTPSLVIAGLALALVILFLWLSLPRPVMGAAGPDDVNGSPNTIAPLAAGTVITIPKGTAPSIDGNCGTSGLEYDDAAKFTFTEMSAAGGPVTSTVYLKHDNTYLYVCMEALLSQYPGHFASVYLDYENGREPYARYDDLSLRVDIMGNFTSTYRGTGVPGGYIPSVATGWSAAASGGNYDMAEYKIPVRLAILGGLCHRPFGIAVYHHWVSGVGKDYGWPSNEFWDQPQTWQTAQLDNATCNSTLPVFRLNPVTVTGQTAQGLAGLFGGIGSLPPFSDTSHAGTPRFTVPNTDTGSLLEQYGPSGGFFAFNAGGAFSVTDGGQLDPTLVRREVCQFLSSHGLFSPQVLPEALPPCSDRVGDLPYQVTGIFAAKAPSLGIEAIGAAQVVTTGVLVQIPLGVDTGQGNPLPMRGPGGHLSLIVVTTTIPVQSHSTNAPGLLLDNSFPGLAALAVPFSRTLESRGNYTVTDSSQAIQTLRAMMSGAVITPGNPELVYYADDPAAPQPNLIPTWYFPNATALIDGHEVSLRGYSTSAVPDFMPNVQITSPPNGTVFVVGSPLTITGNISGGQAPYSYTWLMEDGSAMSGDTAGGAVSLVTSTLASQLHEGGPLTVTVRLRATDSNGAMSEAYLALQPGPIVYLPIVLRNWPGLSSLVVSNVSPRGGASPAAPMTFGIEAGWDYPPYGPGGSDLPGVIPDAFGFQSGMWRQGWTQRFFWANAGAWEKDWRDCSISGGADCTYGVDRADFVYYPGHGGGGGIAVPSNNHDSGWAAGANMRFQQARWIGFASCATLRAQGYSPATSAPIFTEFHNSFQGSHMLLGFNSGMADVAFGPRLVDNMRMPMLFGAIPMPWAQHTIAEAWVLTAFEMNAGKPAYMWVVGSNGYDPYFDKLPGLYTSSPWGRPYPFTSWNWVWWDE